LTHFVPIHTYQPVVKECKGCTFVKERMVGGDNTLICCCHIYPHTKWWYNMECEDYTKENFKGWKKYYDLVKDLF